MRNYFFITLIIVIISSVSFGEVHAKVNNLQLDKLSVKDGLSQGTINAMLQDNSGLIWLGTENGVNLYDGYTLRTLAGPDGDFDSFSVYNLMQDSQDKIWLNVYGKGLYTYRPKTNVYELIFATDSENQNYIVEVVEGRQNQFWIATSKTINLYDQSSKTLQLALDLSAQLTNQNNIYQITLANDLLYIGTRIGVFVFNTQTKEWLKLDTITQQSSNNDHVNEFEAAKVFNLQVSDDTLYLGSNDGVYSLDIHNIATAIAGKTSLSSYQLVVEGIGTWDFILDNHQLYIASDKGLFVVDTINNHAEHLFGFSDLYSDVTDDKIISLLKDKNGLFWLGTNATGVYRWNPAREYIQNFSYLRHSNNSLSFGEVWSIEPHATDANLLWVGTANGLNLVDTQSRKVEQFLVNPDSKSMYTLSYIYQISQDSQQRLLLSTPKGVRVFDSKHKAIIEQPFSKEMNDILAQEQASIFIDPSDNLWTVNKDGFFKLALNSGEIEEISAITSRLAAESIYNILGYLPQTDLLLFSSNDSLWAFNTKNQEVQLLYKHPDVLSTERVSIDNWVIDQNNTLWLSFSGQGIVGLSLPDFSLKHLFNKENSSINKDVYGVMLDEQQNLWFSSHSGLFMLDNTNFHLRNFTDADGLVAMEYNANAHAQLADGRLVYGSMEGLSIFSPQQFTRNFSNEKLVVHVTNIDTLSRSLDLPLQFDVNDEVNLQYDDVGIRLDVSTFSYLESDRTRYLYRLLGTKTIDYPETYENHIIFPDLPSGLQTLSVQAKSPITGQLSAPLLVKFMVSYAPWRSPVAYFVYAIVVLMIILFWYVRKEVQRQQLIDDHEQIKYRENRLQLALTGSNSEVWDWQAHNNLMFGKRASQDLGYSALATSYSFLEHIELIHPDDRDNFLSSWQQFIASADKNKTFSCNYRLKNVDGLWLWYKDLGKIVAVDSHNIPIRITGSYTNITQAKADAERALYYGDAFKQTKDWVLIISDNFTRVTANQSLRDVFGWESEEFEFSSNLLGLSRNRKQFYRQVFSSLKEGEHWRGEDLILTKEGDEHHVIINVNVSINNSNNSLHYICVFTDITAQKAAEQELRYLANYDHLTNLPNRSLLLDRIEHAMELSKRKATSIALFFIDLDRFKQINDSLGHDYGDMLLKEVTYRLSEALRAEDTVARIGGDEFVILLESFKGNGQLGHIAQKVIEAIEQPVTLNENVVSIGASIGIALYPEDAQDSDQLLRSADVAMYHAKQLGRNTFQFYTKRMNYEASERLKLESKLKLAHTNKEFINYYQPIVDAKTGKSIGVELLMRWQSDEGLISPLTFIPVVEELGLIVSMTEDAFVRGIADLKVWRTQRPELFMSVNLSPQHFVTDSLVPYIKKLLTENNIPANALKLEVTESALISQPDKAIKTMQALSEFGVKLALDDFGTGFSSLSYLKSLPLDIIKIDRSFVSGIERNKSDKAIVDAILVLAKNLNMRCIAEGVENKFQLDYFTENNCFNIQGFFYSKPVNAATINDFLTNNTL